MIHGGDLRALAVQADCAPSDILDFSASINPLGPPTAVSTILSRAADLVLHYPDPGATGLCHAIADFHGLSPSQIVAGNGSSELLTAIARAFSSRHWVVSEPCYSGYEHAAQSVHAEIRRVPRITPDFGVDWRAVSAACQENALVALDHTGNPTGRPLDFRRLAELVHHHRKTMFLVDESFSPFISDESPATKLAADNVIVIRSMTKFFAIPGLRLGYALASDEVAVRLSATLPEWNVNAIAQHVGTHCIGDQEFADRSRRLVAEWRTDLGDRLTSVPGVEVYPSSANFMLCRLSLGNGTAQDLADRLLHEDRIAIRVCRSFEQLDDQHFRVAVRTNEENQRLVDAVARIFAEPPGGSRQRFRTTKRRTPALMMQGVSSNAGKSILTAAFCRIFARDGVSVAPFKSQNMSLNSFVTRGGCEISRAQVVQAQAARLEPDVRMNPILLKPNSQMGSQVIVDGHPVGNMRVKEYHRFKPQAFEHAKRAYDALADEHDLIVLEGAGSPGEVNLKRHDIVNMNMARHANANVLLVGDIDRGGVFASFVGTMAVLEAWERKLVAGYLVNRFRGDASLLDDAYTYMLRNTGKPVLGTVPNIDDLAIPDEDSVTFKREVSRSTVDEHRLDFAIIDLPHISNLSDFDPLKVEPDVQVRTVREPDELGKPDVVLLPGSRNTIHDLQHLRNRGFEPVLQTLAKGGSAELIGICGGFQMLGRMISDPNGVESSGGGSVAGLGLLDVSTELANEKTLRQIEATHVPSAQCVTGYEIHHGSTEIGNVTIMLEADGKTLAVSTLSGRVWGTYLHGAFEQDGFRRWLVDRVRKRKGMPPLDGHGACYDLNAAYDALADTVVANVDMKIIYGLLGL